MTSGTSRLDARATLTTRKALKRKASSEDLGNCTDVIRANLDRIAGLHYTMPTFASSVKQELLELRQCLDRHLAAVNSAIDHDADKSPTNIAIAALQRARH